MAMELSASDRSSRFSSFSLFLDSSFSFRRLSFPACSFRLAKACDRHFPRQFLHRSVTLLSTPSQNFSASFSSFCFVRGARVSAQNQKKKIPQVSYPASDLNPPANVPSPSPVREDGDNDAQAGARENPDEQIFSTTESDASVAASGRVEGDGGVFVEANETTDLVDASLEKLKKDLAEAKLPIRDFVEGVLEETRLIEWPSLRNVFRTTGVVLTIIFLSSVVVLTVNAILAEFSDKIFNNPAL